MFNFVYKNIDFAHKIDTASQPSENYFKHLHYFNEIIYFVKGDVRYTVESKSRDLTEGDIILIPSGHYHFATVNSEVNYERYVLKFPNNILPAELAKKMQTRGPFFKAQRKYSFIFNQLDTYFGKYSDDDLLTLFLCETVRMLVMLCSEPTHSMNQPRGIIADLIAYVDENIRNALTLDAISEQFSFSKSYISNEFRKYMKIPLMQYVRAKKIIAAHQMILSGEKKHVVAETFGFDDYSTFYRSYVKVMGFPPNDIKKELQ